MARLHLTPPALAIGFDTRRPAQFTRIVGDCIRPSRPPGPRTAPGSDPSGLLSSIWASIPARFNATAAAVSAMLQPAIGTFLAPKAISCTFLFGLSQCSIYLTI